MTPLTRLDHFDNFFPEMLRRLARPMQMDISNIPMDIRLDICENDKEYLVKAEIPGAKKEDIHVAIDGNHVSISAEIKKEYEDTKTGKKGRMLIKETYQGSLSRDFVLGSEVDDKAAVAKLKNGVLELTLPKHSNGKSRHILQIQ